MLGIRLASAAGLFTLAAAIGYFAYQLGQIRTDLPPLLRELQVTADRIGPVADRIDGLQRRIPEILAESRALREAMPALLAESTAIRTESTEIRRTLPAVLAEVEATRKAVPPILDAVPFFLEESRNFRSSVPPVLAEISEVRDLIPNVLDSTEAAAQSISRAADEVREVRIMVPGLLIELEKTRQAVGNALIEAGALIDRADSVGQRASEGAVAGLFSGVIAAPFRLIGNLVEGAEGKAILGTEKLVDVDHDLFLEALAKFEGEEAGSRRRWTNADTGASGEITLQDRYENAGEQCYRFRHIVRRLGSFLDDKAFSVCLERDGTPRFKAG